MRYTRGTSLKDGVTLIWRSWCCRGLEGGSLWVAQDLHCTFLSTNTLKQGRGGVGGLEVWIWVYYELGFVICARWAVGCGGCSYAEDTTDWVAQCRTNACSPVNFERPFDLVFAMFQVSSLGHPCHNVAVRVAPWQSVSTRAVNATSQRVKAGFQLCNTP